MKNKERVKQIFLSCIAIGLIALGYTNYSFNNKDESIEVSSRSSENEINLGDVELVSSTPINSNYIEGIVSNDNLQNCVETNTTPNYLLEDNSNYFEETRIERDRMYSETIETYQRIVESNQTMQDQKAIATQEITNITNKKNSILICENLIKNKGFKDVVILENNGNVSVIVKSTSLSQEQISKIQNIVSRELNVEMSNISISNK